MGVRQFDDNLALPPNLLGKRPLDRDKLALLPRSDCAHAAHLALFQLQDKGPEEQVMGAAVLFAALCMACGLDADDMYQMGKRVLTVPNDMDRHTDNSLQTLRDFIGARVMAREVTIG